MHFQLLARLSLRPELLLSIKLASRGLGTYGSSLNIDSSPLLKLAHDLSYDF
jgi:hypothetical protein